MRAVGDVDAHVVARGDQAFLHVAAHAVEHLELEALSSNAPCAGELLGVGNDGFVVRGDGGIVAVLQQQPHQAHVVAIGVALAAEGNVRRLVVRAFAQPHAHALAHEPLHVGRAAVQIRLDDGAHVVVAGCPHVLDQLERPPRIR